MDPPPRQHHRTTPPHAGGREDCWSDGATKALVEAWGDRFVDLKRGHLRQKDWQDVADAVNEHQDALGRPRRTDVQCKNRIDTLKKKYKIEKARRGPSHWSFFSRLDELIGPSSATPASGSTSATLKKHQVPKTEPVRMPQRPSLKLKLKNRSSSNPRQMVYSEGSSSSENEDGGSNDGDDDDVRNEEEEEDDEDHDHDMFRPLAVVPVPKKRRWDGLNSIDGAKRVGGGGAEDTFGELAKAIVKFGEIYERVESVKQQQMMEMERQRMEFAKDLEFHRMKMFMETQLELEKMKRPKYSSNSGSK